MGLERKLKDVKSWEDLYFEIVEIESGKVVRKEKIRIPRRKIESFYNFLLLKTNLENYFVRIVDEEGNIIII